jgi:hypothetical protein
MKILSVGGVGSAEEAEREGRPVIVVELEGTLDDLRAVGALLYQDVTITPVPQSGIAPTEESK